MLYSHREVIIIMNTITLLTAALKLFHIFRGWHRDAKPKKENREAEHVQCVIQVCDIIAAIVNNTLMDVLVNSR